MIIYIEFFRRSLEKRKLLAGRTRTTNECKTRPKLVSHKRFSILNNLKIIELKCLKIEKKNVIEMSKNWRKKFQLGRKQQHELGAYIRKRYYNLIGDNGSYHHKKVYAQVRLCPHDKFLFLCTLYSVYLEDYIQFLLIYRCRFNILPMSIQN